MKFLFLIKVILFSSVVSVVFGDDYCNPKLCSGRLHIGCKNPGVSEVVEPIKSLCIKFWLLKKKLKIQIFKKLFRTKIY